jgi:hypothetical protein
MEKEQTKHVFRQFGYKESFAIAAILTVAGYLLQLLTPNGIGAPVFPVNMIIILTAAAIIVWIYLTGRENNTVRWLHSAPAAVSAIAMLGVQTIIMGTVPQEENSTSAFQNVQGSWAFALTLMYFLLVLGITVVHRCYSLQLRNIPFILNHAGLWIALAAGALGSSDFQRLSMQLEEGKSQTMANDGMRLVPQEFSIRLDDFVLREYDAKLALVQTSDGKNGKKPATMRQLRQGDKYDFNGYSIEILKYFKNSYPVEGGYEQGEQYGSAPSAYVQVRGTGVNVTGWVSCGNFMMPPSYLTLIDSDALVMTDPEPEAFESHVTVFVKGESEPRKAVIEVNKPYKVKGSKIYQVGYDSRFGKYSASSELGIVKDPWLPAVYIGVFMMIAGAVCMIFRWKI